MTTRLEHRSWASIPDGPLVLVPVGSTEQHGPHLPLDTDTVIATAVALGIADRVRRAHPNSDVLVAPAVPYGAGGDQSFPGTVSIGHYALRVMLVELVRSLSAWAGPVVFVNGHCGSIPTLQRVVRQLSAEHRNADWVPCLAPTDAHAGRRETSLMLHLSQSGVELPVAGPRAGPGSGVLVGPTGASAAEGRAVLDEMVTSAFFRLAVLDIAVGTGAGVGGRRP